MPTKLEKAARQIIDAWNYGSPFEKYLVALDEALADQAEQVEQKPMKECRHCGFLCKPNPNESGKWYPLEQAEQEPVGEMRCDASTGHCFMPFWYGAAPTIGTLIYAAPVRTKDLTDDEILQMHTMAPQAAGHVGFARAVIAADREKNK